MEKSVARNNSTVGNTNLGASPKKWHPFRSNDDGCDDVDVFEMYELTTKSKGIKNFFKTKPEGHPSGDNKDTNCSKELAKDRHLKTSSYEGEDNNNDKLVQDEGKLNNRAALWNHIEYLKSRSSMSLLGSSDHNGFDYQDPNEERHLLLETVVEEIDGIENDSNAAVNGHDTLNDVLFRRGSSSSSSSASPPPQKTFLPWYIRLFTKCCRTNQADTDSSNLKM